MGASYRLQVGDEDEGLRLDRFLHTHIEELSRTRLAALIAQGDVCVDGSVVSKTSRRMERGESVEVDVPDAVPMALVPEALPIDVLFEDKDLVIVNKAAGMVVHPSPGHPSGTLVNALLHHCDDLSGIGGVERPGIVHRLDRNTSGVLVVAKSDRAHRALVDAFAERRVHKTYLAWVKGTPPQEGNIETPYARHPKHRKRFTGQVEGELRAKTSFFREASEGKHARLRVTLHTGRTHQIRVHLSEAGYPIEGDDVYGQSSKLIGRHALHAWKITFEHPIERRDLEFEAPIPEDLRSLDASLQLSP